MGGLRSCGWAHKLEPLLQKPACGSSARETQNHPRTPQFHFRVCTPKTESRSSNDIMYVNVHSRAILNSQGGNNSRRPLTDE